ncbi:MAG: helix-turn-helix domain-containing protein [Sulfitobacter sp.]|uniref:helix-turn-helix domain-containing protein n=1 Tax=Alphaproteobacteria TaxID=28211 RepID=UPI0032659121
MIEPITAKEMQQAYFWAAQCHPELARARNPEEYAADFARRHGIRLPDFFGKTRTHDVAHRRQECMAELRQQGFTLSRIARLFKRDHTTVQHGIEAVKRRKGL